MGKVDLVDPGASGKFTASPAGAGNGLVILFLNGLGDGLGKSVQLSGDRIGELCQISDRQSSALAGCALLAGVDKAVDNISADLGRGHGCIFAQRRQPVGVVPADAGLCFFGRDHIVRVAVEHESGLGSRHQAGVESDEVKFHTAGLESFIDARQAHGTACFVFFIISVSADRT